VLDNPVQHGAENHNIFWPSPIEETLIVCRNNGRKHYVVILDEAQLIVFCKRVYVQNNPFDINPFWVLGHPE